MHFTLTAEQKLFQDLALEFAHTEILPYAAHWDQTHFFPKETLKKAAAIGFAGIYTRSDVGGSNLSRIDAAIIFEALSTACVSTAAYLSIHNMVNWMIDQYGTPQLRHHYCPLLTNMTLFGSYCLTEPDSGSDAASMKSLAIQHTDHYLLNGSKSFISGGSAADIYLCMVKTQLPDGKTGISCLLVDKNTPGLTFGTLEKKLGWHSQPTAMLYFENCKIPIEHRVGVEHGGFKIAMNALNGGRVNIAACSLGGASACLTLARQYTAQREQFGQPLNQFQAIQFKLADMATDLHAARLMTYQAAYALEHHIDNYIVYCAMAKRYTSDLAFHIANDALQLHGGYGYLQDYPVERYFRDLRVHSILEGTNEIMRVIIARHLLNNAELA
jgi:alkylation response protein AidB-like acyl-CoA dehydrogenase